MSEGFDVCKMSYRDFLRERMLRTWRRIREEESRGAVIGFEDFGRILHEESDKLRAERRRCKLR
jgi:hypothetical protein